jgi:hypothetical protein
VAAVTPRALVPVAAGLPGTLVSLVASVAGLAAAVPVGWVPGGLVLGGLPLVAVAAPATAGIAAPPAVATVVACPATVTCWLCGRTVAVTAGRVTVAGPPEVVLA